MVRLLLNFILLFLISAIGSAQSIDSTLDNLKRIPTKYLNGIDKKINQYSNRITNKTGKTLTRLSRWENKIHGMLQKVSPEADQRLFGNNQLTFSSLQKKIKEGEAIALQYQAQYDKYRDDVTTSLKYISQQKELLDSGLLKKVKATREKMKGLAAEEDKSEAIQQFIKERKKQLIAGAFQYIGKSKYLTKINKEAYYYAETLKNHKEIFSDSKKAEETVINMLNKIPAFKSFMQQNGELAKLFGSPVNNNALAAGNAMPGLQTRASVQAVLQQQIGSAINPQQYLQQQMQSAQAELSALKNKLEGVTSGEVGNGKMPEMPGFSPNGQKNKSFLKRLQVGWNLQTGGTPNRFTSINFPTTNDIAASIGCKLNDRSIVGIGAAYKFGLGAGFKNLAFTHDGIGLRTFMEYKITSPKKGLRQLFSNIWLSGGYEQNYWSRFGNISELFPSNNPSAGRGIWKKSGLLGVSKKVKRGKREMKIQALWDFMSYDTGAKPFVFRIGYNL